MVAKLFCQCKWGDTIFMYLRKDCPYFKIVTDYAYILFAVLSANANSGQSYKHFTIINYDSRVIPDWKIPHITTWSRNLQV